MRGYLTLLHLPTTTSLLSIIIVSSLTSSNLYLDRFILILTEAFLMIGVVGNFLDEIKGRPWMTNISTPVLWCFGVGGLLSSSAIGLYLSIQVGWWFMAFVVSWGFLTVSYSLELFDGKLHNTITLCVLVALASLGASLIQNSKITIFVLVIAGLSAIISGYGRQHYELGKPAGKDDKYIPSAHYIWRWLMFEIIIIDTIATVTLVVRTLA